jgi:asparagine synthase (glutamine-hydrolysing)
MCGIAGYIGSKIINHHLINKSLDLLQNRGPDFNNIKKYSIISKKYKNILFLHTRLSIIDLEKRSNQPFEDGDYSVIFNGEIYNYLEIKKDLILKGFKFHTTSDTEVLLKSYIVYGMSFFKKLEGMWSFAIWDKKNNKLILSRDRFGEKPLFYSKQNDGIYFSSDIRVIRCLSEKNYDYNISRLTKGVVCGYKSLYKNPSETFFKDILQIPQASYMEIKDNLEIKINKYWSIKKTKIDFKKDSELIDQAKDLLFNSIKIRLRSDVPLAFCLSGGIDSGALVSVAVKKFNIKANTFSILDNKDIRYNEKKNIDTVVRDISSNHHEINIKDIQNNFNNIERLKTLISYKSGPIPTITYFLHSFLSESISKNNFKVAISGTAADEVYSGYYDHHLQYLYDNRNKKQFNLYKKNFEELVKPLIRNPYLKKFNLYINNKSFRKHIYDSSEEFVKLLRKDVKIDLTFFEKTFTSQLLKNRSLNELFYETTPVILNEDDTNSMYYSIENRSPFLDSNLFNFIYSIPTAKLIQNGYAKFILRESVKNYLHESVRMDRVKKGFNASVTSIFNFSDKKFIDELLNENSPIFEIFNIKKIKKLLKKDMSLNHYSKFIFSFINAKIFLDMKNV